jgi:hypothetical protein
VLKRKNDIVFDRKKLFSHEINKKVSLTINKVAANNKQELMNCIEDS